MVILSGLAALGAIAVCVASIFKRDTLKSLYFSLLALAVVFYLLGNFFEVVSTTYDAAKVAMRISYLGVPFIPTIWFFSVREYCGKPLNNITMLLMLVVPTIFSYLAFTWESNNLLFTGIQFYGEPAVSQLGFIPGPVNPYRLLYQFSINVIGILTIVYQYRHGTPRFRKQASLFLVSALIPFFTTGTFLLLIGSRIVDITPFGLAFTLLLFFFTMQRYGIQNFSSIIKDNVVENMLEGVLLFDQDGTYMMSNRTSKVLFPELENTPIGQHLDAMSFLPFTASVFTANDGVQQEFTRSYDGTLRTYNVSINRVVAKEKLLGYSITIYNITSFKNIVSELEVQANRDPLTGVYNRRFFFQRGQLALEQAWRTRAHLSVIMFDLDFFKRLNDSYGHAYGDYVLRTTAALCVQNLRKTDWLCRYGGEEFCILLPDTPLAGAQAKADYIRTVLSQHPFEEEGICTTVTASFGVAALQESEDPESLEDLIKQADANLYKAKAQGRNCVV